MIYVRVFCYPILIQSIQLKHHAELRRSMFWRNLALKCILQLFSKKAFTSGLLKGVQMWVIIIKSDQLLSFIHSGSRPTRPLEPALTLNRSLIHALEVCYLDNFIQDGVVHGELLVQLEAVVHGELLPKVGGIRLFKSCKRCSSEVEYSPKRAADPGSNPSYSLFSSSSIYSIPLMGIKLSSLTFFSFP